MNKKLALIASAIIIAVVVASVVIYYMSILSAQPPAVLKTLMIGTTDVLENLDVVKARGKLGYLLSTLIYDKPLISQFDLLAPQPWIVTNYTSSADGLTWTVTLRDGVKYHDGTSVNATSVKFHFDRYMEKGVFAYQFSDYLNSTEVIDNCHLAFHLDAPFFLFPKGILMTYAAGLESPTAVISLGEANFDSNPVGCGPWKFVEWVRAERLVLERNEEYWNKDYIPKVDRMIIRFYSESATLKMALLTGEIDVAIRSMSPIDVPSLKENPDLRFVTVEDTYLRYLPITQNDPPLSNILVRQAIAHTINRDEIIERALKGLGVPVYTMANEDLFGDLADPTFQRYEYNITKAQELLAQAGYADGFTTTLEYTPLHYGPMEVDVALVLKEQLARVGIIANLEAGEWASYVSRVSNRLHPALWIIGEASTGMYFDPISALDIVLKDNGWVSYGIYYSRPGNDEIIAEYVACANSTEREEMGYELQNILAEDIPVIPLYNEVDLVWYRYNVHNLVWPAVSHDGGIYLALVEKD